MTNSVKIPILNRIKSFLFENNNIKQVLMKNSFWITLSQVFDKVVRTILLIYLARIIGANEYGKYTFALSFVSIFVSFLDLGLSSIITRELSQDDKAEKDISALITLKILSGTGTIALICTGSFFITSDLEIQKVMKILAVSSFLGLFPGLFFSIWRAKQKMQYEAWVQAGRILLLFICVFFALFSFPSIVNISCAFLFTNAISLTIICFIFKDTIVFSFETQIWKKYLLMSWPLALNSIFGMLYSYTDSILMGYMGQITQTGWYNAALKVVYVVGTPAGIISISFFPVLCKFAKESADTFQDMLNLQIGVILIIFVPIVVGGVLLSTEIINLFYGNDFLNASKVLKILIFMAGATALCRPLQNTLVSYNHQNKVFWATTAGAVLNIVLNLILIPKYSFIGAAYASVISYGIVFMLYYILVKRFTAATLFNSPTLYFTLGALFSSYVMYQAISYSQKNNYHFILITIVSIMTYFVTYLFLYKITKNRLPTFN